MTNTKRIAGLLGPTMIAVTASQAMNFHIWANVTTPVVYLVGVMAFVAGLSIVRVHNQWVRDWPVLITLVGWFAILGGLFRMFAPVYAQRLVKNPNAVYPLLVVLLAVGIFLTIKAYARGES